MNAELKDLYQELILDHQRHPRNFREIRDATHEARGDNPLCGDKITIYAKILEDRIDDLAFQGEGCAICTASASLMTEALKGDAREKADLLFEAFHAVVTGEDGADDTSLGKLAAFSGVSEFPVRVKCATLAWHTLRAALKGSENSVSTE